MLETVSQVVSWYESNEIREFAPDALKERQRLWKLFAVFLGSKPLNDCCPADLLAFIASQKGCKAHWTRRRIRGTICRPFNHCAAMGIIARNPFRGVRIPKGKNGRDWTDAEQQAILRVSEPYFRRLVVFMRFSGARPGEARNLEWSHIQEQVEAIIQRQHKTDDLSDEPRRIHFNSVFLRLLNWIRRHKSHNTYVFVNRRGRPWTVRALCAHMAIVRERAGLPKDVKNHGGRHTFCTNGIINGVDPATMSELLGHKSLATIQVYLHLIDKRKHLNEAMEKAIRRKP